MLSLPAPCPNYLAWRFFTVVTTFRLSSGTAHRSLIYWSHRLSFLRCTAYRLRGAQQTSSGKTNRVYDHPVATTRRATDRHWASLLRASLPARKALRRFVFARNDHTPMASTRHALAGPLAYAKLGIRPIYAWCSRLVPLPLSVSGSFCQGPGSGLSPSSLLAMPIALVQKSEPSAPRAILPHRKRRGLHQF